MLVTRMQRNFFVMMMKLFVVHVRYSYVLPQTCGQTLMSKATKRKKGQHKASHPRNTTVRRASAIQSSWISACSISSIVALHQDSGILIIVGTPARPRIHPWDSLFVVNKVPSLLVLVGGLAAIDILLQHQCWGGQGKGFLFAACNTKWRSSFVSNLWAKGIFQGAPVVAEETSPGFHLTPLSHVSPFRFAHLWQSALFYGFRLMLATDFSFNW